MSNKKANLSKKAIVEETAIAQTEIEIKPSLIPIQYPCLFVLKNNTPLRVMDSVTKTLLMPHSERTVEVKSESDKYQILSNFKALNLMNKFDDGLTVAYPIVGDDNA